VAAWTRAQRSSAGSAGAGSGAAGAGASDTHLPNPALAAGVYGGSIACSGLSAAKLAMSAAGESFMDKFVDKASGTEINNLCALQAKWLLSKGLNLTACDGDEWVEFITALRPALADKLLNYERMRYV
jgi:hypothetical protein